MIAMNSFECGPARNIGMESMEDMENMESMEDMENMESMQSMEIRWEKYFIKYNI